MAPTSSCGVLDQAWPGQESIGLAAEDYFPEKDTLTEEVCGRKSKRTKFKPKSLKRMEFHSQENKNLMAESES